MLMSYCMLLRREIPVELHKRSRVWEVAEPSGYEVTSHGEVATAVLINLNHIKLEIWAVMVLWSPTKVRLVRAESACNMLRYACKPACKMFPLAIMGVCLG
jgi:hypothetical protein